jgi:hypothetical protein
MGGVFSGLFASECTSVFALSAGTCDIFGSSQSATGSTLGWQMIGLQNTTNGRFLAVLLGANVSFWSFSVYDLPGRVERELSTLSRR